jgi:parallel beta-helix repeat protein
MEEKEVILVIKDYFQGSVNTQKSYNEDMIGFTITNNHETNSLTFTINGMTIPVKPKQHFKGRFAPFRIVTITSTVPFEATVSALIDPDSDPPTDIKAPILNITPASTFSDQQTVTMNTNETASIFYSTDGTTPTSSSLRYTEPLTIEDTTTIKAFAIDSAGNSSSIQTITYTKVSSGPIQEGLILHYDFTGKAGTSSNTITDKVNNVVATLVGVTHDSSTDGYVDDRGLLLQKQDYVSIPTNSSPLNNLIDFNKGITIQMVSYDTNGSHWKTEDGRFTSYRSLAALRYNKRDGSIGGITYDTFWFRDEKGLRQSYSDWLNPIGSNAINTFTFRINSNKTVNLFINNAINDSGSSPLPLPLPTDFDSFVNNTLTSPLNVRRDFVALNTQPEKIVAFIIYNRALTDNEVRSNHNFFSGSAPLVGLQVQPKEVNLSPGESQILSVQALPDQYTDQLDITFQSGNQGFVTVDESGVLTGVTDGETNISITVQYNNQSFTENVKVKVGIEVSNPPSFSRIIDGMSINRKTDSIEVGEHFVVMATALSSNLPYDVFNENIVYWESSNPNVASVQYGVVEGIAVGQATLTAYDATKTHSKSFELTVTKPSVETNTTQDTYLVPLAQYQISSTNTNSIDTTNGIQKALDYASANNYKKIVFPKGHYLITPTARTIQLPTNMTVDFSDSVINIEPSSLTVTGYRMFLMNNVVNTMLIRAHVFGEADSTTVNNSVEGCISLLIEDCANSGIEACTFSKSPGFNVITGTRHNLNMGKVTKSISVIRFNFEAGNINEQGQIDNTITKNYYRYNQFMDISGLGEYYLLGYTQGYHGYPHLRSRLYSIHFYDSNYQHISSQMYNLQYYNYPKPANARYAKIVIYQESPPTTGDTDFGGTVAFIRTLGMPRDCFIKNCTFENNFSTGLALCGGQGWLIEGNTFSNNKGRMPGCDIDWEDGWEHMVGDVLKNNTFNSPLGVIMSAGASLSAFENTFNRSALTVWGRTQNWRIFNNFFNGKPNVASPSLSTQGDSVFARNILKGLHLYNLSTLHGEEVEYKIHDLDNIILEK